MNAVPQPQIARDTSATPNHQPIVRHRSTSHPTTTYAPLPIQPQRSLPLTLDASSPAHIYRPIRQNGSMPEFRNGRNRFPPAEHRFWHLKAHLEQNRYERLPGEFDEEDFMFRWRRISWRIDDHWITDIQPETEYGGIRYRITMHPGVWEGHTILRGDTLVFRGMDHDDIKYFITWTLNKNHDDKHAYVQVNAFNQFQGNLDSGDADWPALGFLVPKSLCEVLIARPLPMVPDPFDLNAQLAPNIPELHPTPDSPIQRRRAHVWEKPLQGFLDFANLNVLTRCKKPLPGT
jgi:hypothetical protein